MAGNGEEKILDAECWMTKKRLVLDSGRWSLDSLFVNFEPFCGQFKPVERPESSRNFPRRGVILLSAARLRRDWEVEGGGGLVKYWLKKLKHLE